MTYEWKGEVVEPYCQFDRTCEACNKRLHEIWDNWKIVLKTKEWLIEVLLSDKDLIIK